MKLLPASLRKPGRALRRQWRRIGESATANSAHWPTGDAFVAIDESTQLTAGAVVCRRVALCDAFRQPIRELRSGDELHVYLEYETLADLTTPAFLLRLGDGNENVLLRSLVRAIDGPIAPGQLIRVHHVLSADVPPGVWFLDAECITPAKTLTIQRHAELLEEDDLLVGCDKHCFARLTNLPVIVRPRALRPAGARSSVRFTPAQSTSPKRTAASNADFPTLLHVTHWKAGSQWIYALLRSLFPDRIVPPQVGNYQVRNWPIQPGRVYPTVYSTRQDLAQLEMPISTRKLVVLRDLRDTLISWYFSFKKSHAVMTTRMAKYRDLLNTLDVEDGLLAMIEYQLQPAAEIQSSWAGGPEPIVKYEDLLQDDFGVLKRVFIDEFRLPVPDESLRRAVESCRFEKVSGGRQAGEADQSSHYRKGIAGDWRNYFTPRVAEAFKARFGEVLIATGYERDANW